ncbi:hypothetical protein HD554DRAFT_2169058 [Boletus coccyginus]|nr:hypothetical protein HD554DRAFT_2169058 [Boletus coccyginus]
MGMNLLWVWVASTIHNSLKLYNEIIGETKYIYSDTDTKGKFNNFSSAALRDLCVMGYYVSKSFLAALFPDIFSKYLPAGTLAFATMALTTTIDEYSTDSFTGARFCYEGYSRVNEQFLDMIGNIKQVPHHLQSLKVILKNIVIQGW